jgi:hypothetical protein
MIEGIHLDFKSSEIKKHLLERAQHHKEREVFYLTQVKKIRKAGAERAAYGADPLSALEKKAESHRERRDLFVMMAQHIIPNEVYRLTETDLGHIELPGRSYDRWHLG